jgi:hypothetical protein
MTREKIRGGIIGANVRYGWGWVPPAVPGGPPVNIAQLFKHLADGIHDGRPADPRFDLAVTRHRLLDAIQKASDSGVRQVV